LLRRRTLPLRRMMMSYSSAQWDPVGKASQAIWQGAAAPAEAMAAAQKAADDAVSQMK